MNITLYRTLRNGFALALAGFGCLAVLGPTDVSSDDSGWDGPPRRAKGRRTCNRAVLEACPPGASKGQRPLSGIPYPNLAVFFAVIGACNRRARKEDREAAWSDEDLCRAYRTTRSSAYVEALLDRYGSHLGRVAGAAASKASLGLDDADDLVVILRLSLVHAAGRYEPCHGATFRTFLHSVLLNAARNYTQTVRRTAWRHPQSLDEFASDDERDAFISLRGRVRRPSDPTPRALAPSWTMEALCGALPPPDRCVVQAVAEDWSAEALARALGCSADAARARRSRLLRKLRAGAQDVTERSRTSV